MKFELTSSQKILKLIEIFKIIKNLNNYCCLFCKEDHVYIQTMDGSHVCLLDVKIMKGWFDNYESESCMVCFHASIIVKILSLYLPKTSLKMQTNKSMDKMEVDLLYPDKIVKSFEIPLIDMDTEILETGDTEYGVDLTMRTKVFDKYINEIIMFGDVLSIKCKDENMFLSTNGNEGKYQIMIPHENMEEFVMEEDLKLNVKTNAKYLAYISKLYCVFKHVQIQVDNQCPIKVYFDDSFSMSTSKKGESTDEEENEEEKEIKDKLIIIEYYVAPKIEDDDMVSDDEDNEDCDSLGENHVLE